MSQDAPARVLVARYASQAPLYRQEGILELAGCATPRSALAQCTDGALLNAISNQQVVWLRDEYDRS